MAAGCDSVGTKCLVQTSEVWLSFEFSSERKSHFLISSIPQSYLTRSQFVFITSDQFLMKIIKYTKYHIWPKYLLK
jgi:hypothetical protein